jgi:hypothetical protein
VHPASLKELRRAGKHTLHCLNQPVDVGDEFLGWFQPGGDLLGLKGDKIVVISFVTIIE